MSCVVFLHFLKVPLVDYCDLLLWYFMVMSFNEFLFNTAMVKDLLTPRGKSNATLFPLAFVAGSLQGH